MGYTFRSTIWVGFPLKQEDVMTISNGPRQCKNKHRSPTANAKFCSECGAQFTTPEVAVWNEKGLALLKKLQLDADMDWDEFMEDYPADILGFDIASCSSYREETTRLNRKEVEEAFAKAQELHDILGLGANRPVSLHLVPSGG